MKLSNHPLILLGFAFLAVLSLFSNGFSYEDNQTYPANGIYLGVEGDYHNTLFGDAFDHISFGWYDDNTIKTNLGFSIFLGVTSDEERGKIFLVYQRHVLTVPDLDEKVPFNAIKIGGDYFLIPDSRIQPYARVSIGYVWMNLENYWMKTHASFFDYKKNLSGLAMEVGAGMHFWILNNLSINFGFTLPWLYFRTLGGDGKDQFCIVPNFGLCYIF